MRFLFIRKTRPIFREFRPILSLLLRMNGKRIVGLYCSLVNSSSWVGVLRLMALVLPVLPLQRYSTVEYSHVRHIFSGPSCTS